LEVLKSAPLERLRRFSPALAGQGIATGRAALVLQDKVVREVPLQGRSVFSRAACSSVTKTHPEPGDAGGTGLDEGPMVPVRAA